MTDLWQSFILTFVPIFIVIDALGNLPFVISMTEGVTSAERQKIIRLSVFTAAVVGLVFLFLGRLILEAMNISVGSFAIAGGIILLVFAIRYMTTGHMVEIVREEMVAVVPIGTPLTVGPATITTLLLLSNQYPLYIVLISFMLNILLTWVIFLTSDWIVRLMGRGGLRAVSRVFSLLLAAIAITMVVNGLGMLHIINTAG